MPFMQATIVSIGNELTGGHIVNHNAAEMARRLAELGIACRRHVSIPDEPSLIIRTLREAMDDSALVLTTGGLGPTVDDLTLEAIADATDRDVIPNAAVAARIRAFYRRYRRRLNQLAMRQALLPRGATALANPLGTAPGIWLPLERSLLVALPGVPREMRAILEGSVVPRLKRLAHRAPILTRTIRTIGVPELEIQHRLGAMRLPRTVSFGLYPHLRMVDVRFAIADQPRRTATRILDRLEHGLRQRMGAAVYGTGSDTLEEALGQALRARRWTAAMAESCTGGLVADRITNVSGSSDYFLLSVVAYQNEVKERLLGVPHALLVRRGAVSAPVAKAMATGVRTRAGAALGLGITGIAGPTGGSARKPVGLVYMALADAHSVEARRFHFVGDRLSIKHQAAQEALDWIRRRALAERHQ